MTDTQTTRPNFPPPSSPPNYPPPNWPPAGSGWQPQPTGPQPLAPVPGPRTGAASWRNRFLAGLVLVAVAVGGGVTGAAVTDGRDPVVPAPVAAAGGQSAPSQPLARVAAAVQPSVVSIQVTGSGESGEGSGIVLRSDGTILTNNHVVAAAANGGSITVRFSDGRTAPARIAGRDPSTDLAVLRTENVSGLRPATLGSSNGLNVGDTVLALGSPLGLEGSVSSGIVSALHRTVNLGGEPGGAEGNSPFGGQTSSPAAVVTDAIQTDAAINPGNSGGPLVDTAGRVVGINTAIASLGGGSGTGTQSGNIGVGFSIPIDQAKAIADQLVKGQTPSHAQLGVSVSDATNGDATNANAPAGGAVVGQVSANSGAQKAGLRTGDVIVQAGETPVTNSDALVAAVRSRKPGDTIALTYTRNGERRTANVTLGSSS